MKNKKFRFLALMMALCLFVGTLPAYATNPYGSVTLTFTSEEDIDLSGIVVSVYEAVPATYTDEYVVYNETLSFTTESNARGVVTFAKPSQYCSITVELDTLPSGVGVSTQTKFLKPDTNTTVFSASEIHHIETTMKGTTIVPSFYSIDGEILNTHYEIVPFDNNLSNMTWQEINELDNFSISGQLICGTKEFPYSVPIDISQYNILDKYKILYKYDLLTEIDMMLGQCEALADPANSDLLTFEAIMMVDGYRAQLLSNEENIDMHPVTVEPYQYSETTQITEETLITNRILELSDEIISTNNTLFYTAYSENEVCVAYSFLNITDVQQMAEDIADEMLKIYAYFINYIGLQAPQNKVRIAIRDMENYGAANISDNVPRMYINPTVFQDSVPERWKTTLAHEYQHAIQFASYGYTVDDNSWSLESMANFASAMYAMNILGEYPDHVSEYTWGIESYYSTTTQSIKELPPDAIENNARDYSMLFPLYLYFNTGASGWNTIIKIYETAKSYRESNAADEYAEIDLALKSINSTYSLKAIFENFARDNLIPNANYGAFYSVDWGSPAQELFSADNSYTMNDNCVERIAAAYYKFYNLSDAELTVTFDIPTNYSDFTFWTAIHNDTTIFSTIGTTNPQKLTATSNRFTIQYYHGAPTEYPYYSIIVVNTNLTTDLDYSFYVN